MSFLQRDAEYFIGANHIAGGIDDARMNSKESHKQVYNTCVAHLVSRCPPSNWNDKGGARALWWRGELPNVKSFAIINQHYLAQILHWTRYVRIFIERALLWLFASRPTTMLAESLEHESDARYPHQSASAPLFKHHITVVVVQSVANRYDHLRALFINLIGPTRTEFKQTKRKRASASSLRFKSQKAIAYSAQGS